MNCQDVKQLEGGGHGFIELDFALQTPDHVLDLPTGKHIFLSGGVNGEMVMRGYTHITSDHNLSTSTPSRSGVPSTCAVRLAISTITATASS